MNIHKYIADWKSSHLPHPDTVSARAETSFNNDFEKSIYDVVNNEHAYCIPCMCHILSASSDTDLASFCVQHLNEESHKQNSKKFPTTNTILELLPDQKNIRCNACSSVIRKEVKRDRFDLKDIIGEHGASLKHVQNVFQMNDFDTSALISLSFCPFFKDFVINLKCLLCNQIIHNEYSIDSHLKSNTHLGYLKKFLHFAFDMEINSLVSEKNMSHVLNEMEEIAKILDCDFMTIIVKRKLEKVVKNLNVVINKLVDNDYDSHNRKEQESLASESDKGDEKVEESSLVVEKEIGVIKGKNAADEKCSSDGGCGAAEDDKKAVVSAVEEEKVQKENSSFHFEKEIDLMKKDVTVHEKSESGAAEDKKLLGKDPLLDLEKKIDFIKKDIAADEKLEVRPVEEKKLDLDCSNEEAWENSLFELDKKINLLKIDDIAINKENLSESGEDELLEESGTPTNLEPLERNRNASGDLLDKAHVQNIVDSLDQDKILCDDFIAFIQNKTYWKKLHSLHPMYYQLKTTSCSDDLKFWQNLREKGILSKERKDNFVITIINAVHAFCKACQVHIISSSIREDLTTFAEDHINSASHMDNATNFVNSRSNSRLFLLKPDIMKCYPCQKKIIYQEKTSIQTLESCIEAHLQLPTHIHYATVYLDPVQQNLVPLAYTFYESKLKFKMRLKQNSRCWLCQDNYKSSFLQHITSTRHLGLFQNFLKDKLKFEISLLNDDSALKKLWFDMLKRQKKQSKEPLTLPFSGKLSKPKSVSGVFANSSIKAYVAQPDFCSEFAKIPGAKTNCSKFLLFINDSSWSKPHTLHPAYKAFLLKSSINPSQFDENGFIEILNKLHCYCTACDEHIFSSSNFSDSLSLFQNHINGEGHKNKLLYKPQTSKIIERKFNGHWNWNCLICEENVNPSVKKREDSLIVLANKHLSSAKHNHYAKILTNPETSLLYAIACSPFFSNKFIPRISGDIKTCLICHSDFYNAQIHAKTEIHLNKVRTYIEDKGVNITNLTRFNVQKYVWTKLYEDARFARIEQNHVLHEDGSRPISAVLPQISNLSKRLAVNVITKKQKQGKRKKNIPNKSEDAEVLDGFQIFSQMRKEDNYYMGLKEEKKHELFHYLTHIIKKKWIDTHRPHRSLLVAKGDVSVLIDIEKNMKEDPKILKLISSNHAYCMCCRHHIYSESDSVNSLFVDHLNDMKHIENALSHPDMGDLFEQEMCLWMCRACKTPVVPSDPPGKDLAKLIDKHLRSKDHVRNRPMMVDGLLMQRISIATSGLFNYLAISESHGEKFCELCQIKRRHFELVHLESTEHSRKLMDYIFRYYKLNDDDLGKPEKLELLWKLCNHFNDDEAKSSQSSENTLKISDTSGNSGSNAKTSTETDTMVSLKPQKKIKKKKEKKSKKSKIDSCLNDNTSAKHLFVGSSSNLAVQPLGTNDLRPEQLVNYSRAELINIVLDIKSQKWKTLYEPHSDTIVSPEKTPFQYTYKKDFISVINRYHAFCILCQKHMYSKLCTGNSNINIYFKSHITRHTRKSGVLPENTQLIIEIEPNVWQCSVCEGLLKFKKYNENKPLTFLINSHVKSNKHVKHLVGCNYSVTSRIIGLSVSKLGEQFLFNVENGHLLCKLCNLLIDSRSAHVISPKHLMNLISLIKNSYGLIDINIIGTDTILEDVVEFLSNSN